MSSDESGSGDMSSMASDAQSAASSAASAIGSAASSAASAAGSAASSAASAASSAASDAKPHVKSGAKAAASAGKRGAKAAGSAGKKAARAAKAELGSEASEVQSAASGAASELGSGAADLASAAGSELYSYESEISEAVSAASSAASAAESAASSAASAAGSAASSLASDAKPALSEAGSYASSVASDVKRAGKKANKVVLAEAGRLIKEAEPKAKVVEEELGEVFAQMQAGGRKAAKVIQEVDWEATAADAYCVAAEAWDGLGDVDIPDGFTFDFINFDIFRDFFQVISLFGLTFPDNVTSIFLSISSFLALSIPQFLDLVINIQFSGYWYIFIIIFSLFMVALFMFASFSARTSGAHEGLELRQWSDFKTVGRILTVTTTILTTVYLPACEAAVGRFFCTEDNEDYTKFPGTNSQGTCGYFPISAAILPVITLAIVGFLFPGVMFWSIQENKPKPRLYDAEGNEQEYTLAMYEADLKRDKSPFNFVYKGYERPWAAYKVFIMAIKLVLVCVILATTFFEVEVVRSIVSGGILFVWAGISFYTQPFVSDTSDRIDICGRVTSVITAIFGIVMSFITDAGTLQVMTLILDIILFVNIVCMITLFATGSSAVDRMFRNSCTHKLLLTQDPVDRRTPLFFGSSLNLLTERKKRVWHTFWDNLFFNHPDFQPPTKNKETGEKGQLWNYAQATDASPPYLQDFDGTVGERHAENKKIVETLGFQRVYDALFVTGGEELDSVRHRITHKLVGMDVYLHHEKDRGSNFGRLIVVPFPFTVTMVWDNEDTLETTDNDVLKAIVKQNDTKYVKERKKLRTKLRALIGQTVYFLYHETKTKTKTRTVTRNGETKTESYTVSVDFTFQNGVCSVGNNRVNSHDLGNGNAMNVADGFVFAINYRDGQGVDREGKHWTNEPGCASHDALGITNEFGMSDGLNRLLYHGPNQTLWQNNYHNVLAAFRSYREKWENEFHAKRKTLSYMFWYEVYNAGYCDRKTLNKVLRQYEHGLVGELPERHAEGLDILYARLDHYDRHPVNAAWYIFFHDVWTLNFNLGAFEELEEEMDVKYPKSIAYRPMPREELEAWAEEHGVRKFFKDKLLDRLYARLDDIAQNKVDCRKAPSNFYKAGTTIGGHDQFVEYGEYSEDGNGTSVEYDESYSTDA